MAAVVTVVVLGAGAVRARSATSAGALAALTTTTSTRAPTLVSTTTVTQPRATPSTPPRTSTTTTVAVVAAEPRPSRETCLALAAVNHYRVVAANDAWLRRQLHDLAARNLLAGPQARALQIEEAQAQTEIDAQYAIDRSNCYLK